MNCLFTIWFKLVLSAFIFGFAFPCTANDSLRTEVRNGKSVIIHRITNGETLYSIARKYNVSVADIRRYNTTLKALQVGAEVFVPSKVIQHTDNSILPATDGDQTIETHVVKQGETLYKIAQKYSVSISDLKSWNTLENGGLKVGQTLYLQNPSGMDDKGTDDMPEKPIKKTSYPATESKIETKAEKKINPSGYPEVVETGLAQLETGSLSNDFYSALHATAPLGTIIQVRNKSNDKMVSVRVAGQPIGTVKANVIILINSKTAEKLEIATSTQLVEITYTPVN